MTSSTQKGEYEKNLQSRKATFGETPKEYIEREFLPMDTKIVTGRIYVDETKTSKKGNAYRVVTLMATDAQRQTCYIRVPFYGDQVAHADVLATYHERTITLGITGLDEEKVESRPNKNGKGEVYSYNATDIFLFSQNTVRDVMLAALRDPAGYSNLVQILGEMREMLTTANSQMKHPLPEPESSQAAPTSGVMTEKQLAVERLRYYNEVVGCIADPEERRLFFVLNGFALDCDEWSETVGPVVAACLKRWFEAENENLNRFCHTNWNTPSTDAQKQEFERIISQFPDINEGRRYVIAFRNKLGFAKVSEMHRSQYEHMLILIHTDQRS